MGRTWFPKGFRSEFNIKYEGLRIRLIVGELDEHSKIRFHLKQWQGNCELTLNEHLAASTQRLRAAAHFAVCTSTNNQEASRASLEMIAILTKSLTQLKLANIGFCHLDFSLIHFCSVLSLVLSSILSARVGFCLSHRAPSCADI